MSTNTNNMVEILRQMQNLIGQMADELERLGTTKTNTTTKTNVTTKAGTNDNLELRISDILREIGIPCNLKGYRYLRAAIIMSVEKPEVMDQIVNVLYPNIAKDFNTTGSRVERAIRRAIEVAWDHGDADTLNWYFGYTIEAERGKPTNSQFISRIADKLILESKH